MQQQVELLIQNWDNLVADRIFADNMDLDDPRSFRQLEIATALREIGGLLSIRTIADTISDSLSHLSWKLSGHRGALKVEIRLTPNLPARLQVLNVSAVDLIDS